LHQPGATAAVLARLFAIIERQAMNDPHQTRMTTVQRIRFDEGTGYGFTVFGETRIAPCFSFAFDTIEDAEEARAAMQGIIAKAVWYDKAPV
jgi:hypothetical protein